VPRLDYTCSLDERSGIALSWSLGAGFVDIQVEGAGGGWVSAGVVDDNLKMVAAPPHRVVVLNAQDGNAGVYAMTSYESSGMQAVSAGTFGIAPTLLLSTAGKLVLRYRQHLNASDVPVALDGSNNVMYAKGDAYWPSMHQQWGTTAVYWRAGKCVAPSRIDVPGYLMLVLPLLGALVVMTPFRRLRLGHALLQKRLASISRLPWSVDSREGRRFQR
jgi:hypothetical protein